MANSAIRIANLSSCSSPAATDSFAIESAGDANVQQLSISVLLGNSAANITTQVATSNTLVVSGNSTPANNADNDSRPAGSIWADGTYIYYYDGTEIKRVTLNTF